MRLCLHHACTVPGAWRRRPCAALRLVRGALSFRSFAPKAQGRRPSCQALERLARSRRRFTRLPWRPRELVDAMRGRGHSWKIDELLVQKDGPGMPDTSREPFGRSCHRIPFHQLAEILLPLLAVLTRCTCGAGPVGFVRRRRGARQGARVFRKLLTVFLPSGSVLVCPHSAGRLAPVLWRCARRPEQGRRRGALPVRVAAQELCLKAPPGAWRRLEAPFWRSINAESV